LSGSVLKGTHDAIWQLANRLNADEFKRGRYARLDAEMVLDPDENRMGWAEATDRYYAV
jgi:hypothetical protein